MGLQRIPRERMKAGAGGAAIVAMRLVWLFVVALSAGAQLSAQSRPDSPVNRSLATLDRVHFRLIVPEQSANGSPFDERQLSHLVGVSMRQAYITLLSDDVAYALESMMEARRQLQSDRPVPPPLPRLEVMVATKRQGGFVGLAVWLRLFSGLNTASYNEQGIAPLAEEGPAVRAALERVLQKFSADIAAARKTP
jgi:hypothetical protein